MSADNHHQIEENIEFWRHVFGEERGILHLFSGEHGGDKLKNVKEMNFSYPQAVEDAARRALAWGEEGREVYFCTHLLRSDGKGRRKKENASDVKTLWGDLDGAPVPNGKLAPSVTVESSPGRFHCYWVLKESISPERAEDLNKRLAHEIGADPSGFDLTQVLRVPGTANHKYKDQPTVRLIDANETAYSYAELDALLPVIEEPKAEYEPQEDVEEEPPIALDAEALKVWRGEKPVAKDDGSGEVDRSRSLVKIGRALYDAGANRQWVIQGIKERDEALGWRCYTDRHDADKQYANIFKELEKNGRNEKVPPQLLPPSTNSSDGSDSFFGKYKISPAFPLESLPVSTRRFIREAAESLDCALELVGVPVIAALSTAIGHTRVALIKRSYTESAAVYSVGIAESGQAKTPAMTKALQPIKDLQTKNKKAYKQAMDTYDDQMREYAVEKKKAAKEERAADKPPTKPVFKRTWLDDTTIEALAPVLDKNPRGVGLFRDELSGWVKGFDQYKSGGKGDTRQKFLQIFSNTTTAIDRKGDEEPTIVERPFVAVYGTIQPSLLEELGAGREDGFLSRFLMAYPEPYIARSNDKEVSFAAEKTYAELIEALYRLEPDKDNSGDDTPGPVPFSAEAKALYHNHANLLADAGEKQGVSAGMRYAYPKLKTYLARLSLILALCRIEETKKASGGRPYEQITPQDVEAAAELIKYFESTAQKAYGQLDSFDRGTNIYGEILHLLATQEGSVEGTAEEFRRCLPSAPDTPEGTSKLIRKVVRSTPLITIEDGWRGKERVMKLSLTKKL